MWMNIEKGTWLATRPRVRKGAKRRAVEGVGFDGPASAFFGRLFGRPDISDPQVLNFKQSFQESSQQDQTQTNLEESSDNLQNI